MKIENHIIIAGTMKSGTTNLYNTLIKHRNISDPRIKEPHFFSLDTQTIKDQWNWYINNLNIQKRSIYSIDATIYYFNSLRAIKNIKKYVANPKIIILIRDPAKRIFSHYNHLIKDKDLKIEHRLFNEIVNLDFVVEDYEKLLQFENKKIIQAINEEKVFEDYYGINYLRGYCRANFDSNFEDKNRIYKYFQNTIYSRFVEAYENEFPNLVKVIIFEEYINNPKEILSEVLEFLNLSTDGIPLLKPSLKQNKTYIPKNRFFNNIINIYESSKLLQTYVHLLKKYGLNNMISSFKKSLIISPKISESDYEKIRKILYKEYQYWSKKNPKITKYWLY